VEENFWLALLYAILFYIATATVVLSPVGEWAFRLFNGCKKIKDPALLNRLEPLFMEVKERAQTKHDDFIVDDRINLYICEDDSVNAFAMGRRTICVTHGLLSLSDEEIKAVLGHEFGHLATHDTELTLLITVGNFIITAIVTVIRVILAIYNVIISIIAGILGDEGAIVGLLQAVASFMTSLCINGLMWIWTQLGILLVMKSSRNAEYEADAFSCNLGYTNGMLSFFRVLEHLEGGSGKKERNNIFAALASSHPDTSKRIARIEERAPLALED
jgi:heat shock protein HtpX